MRICIATGIYPPEIGGPAYYAQNLAQALQNKGQTVEVVTFGYLKKLPSGVRHIALFLKLLGPVRRADCIIALDTFSAALPAYAAARIFGKKIIVRTGGDFIWEHYVERTGDLVPLPQFYEKLPALSAKERVFLFLTRFLLARTVVVFSSRFQKDVWTIPYRLKDGATRIIANAIVESFESIAPKKKNFLFFGRDLKLRNKKRLLEAFQNAKKEVPGIVLEVGQVPQHELIEKIRRSYCVILPSVSDITPNYILDGLRCGKPFILTKYSEYAHTYAEFGVSIDPLDTADMTRKIVEMCDKTTYDALVTRISLNPPSRTYQDLAADFIELAHTSV